MDWQHIRSQFPVTEKYVFLDHAGVSPIPVPGVKALEEYGRLLALHGSASIRRWVTLQEQVRTDIARFIGAKAEEIAYVPSTSHGLSIAAGGLDWKQGDNVIIPDLEFPANVYPWMNLKRLGVELRWWRSMNGRLHMDDLMQLLDSRTRLVSVSAVQYGSGFRLDLAGLATLLKRKGILLCVDGIQHLGAIPMDVKSWGLDFVSADGHKWMLSMEGLGFIFCDQNMLDRFNPSVMGWKSVENALEFHTIDFTLRSDAARFEPGSLNTAGIATLGASLKLISEIGTEQAFQRIITLLDELVEGLKKRGLSILSSLEHNERSGILIFSAGSKNNEVFKRLREDKIVTSLRGGGIRVSPHVYNNSDDIHRFFRALDGALNL